MVGSSNLERSPQGADRPTQAGAEAGGPHARLACLASLALLVASAVLVFSRTMQRHLDHDEHQFVASAALWARDGLLPYRDYPHFHMPYLVFVYGLLGELFGRWLFAARLVSLGAATLTLLLLHGAVRRAADAQAPLVRHGLACGAVLLLLFNPLFAYTSGLAWNHDLAVLLALMCCLVQGAGVRRAALGGVLLGLAIGVRLSMAPLVVPLLCSQLAADAPGTRRRPALALLGGLTLALLPALWLLLLAPQAMLFGNLGYPALNTAYRVAEGFERAMTLPGKVAYLVTDILGEPANLLLALLLLASCLPPGTRGAGTTSVRLVRRAALALPFLLLGALAPTPAWYQYFYALVPFVILVALGRIASSAPGSRALRVAFLLLPLAVTAAAWQTLPEYRTLSNLPDPASWQPLRLHAAGRELASLLAEERPMASEAQAGTPARRARPALVLTLSPIVPLEGGLAIDPAFASGPFAHRSARFLPADERGRHGLVGPDELEAHTAGSPPDALLTGDERRDDAALLEWVARHGYRSRPFGDGLLLHLPPGGG